MGKTARRLAAALAAAGLALAGTATAAQAATCNSGYACFFSDLSYGGPLVQRSASQGNLEGNALNNEATSIATNGSSCTATRFFDASTLTGSYLILDSEEKVGSNFQDPDLRNGGGRGDYSAWDYNDRISGWQFANC